MVSRSHYEVNPSDLFVKSHAVFVVRIHFTYSRTKLLIGIIELLDVVLLNIYLMFESRLKSNLANGKWSSWSSYGSCSVTCGSGVKSRSRTCTNPAPSGGGSTCSGSSQQTAACVTVSCPGIHKSK